MAMMDFFSQIMRMVVGQKGPLGQTVNYLSSPSGKCSGSIVVIVIMLMMIFDDHVGHHRHCHPHPHHRQANTATLFCNDDCPDDL